MLKNLADEDLNNRILRGLVRQKPDLDVLRVQDIHMRGVADRVVLEWASQHERVLLTHDVSTMTLFAHERMRSGQRVADIIEVPQSLPVGQAIEDILLIAHVYNPEEFENRIEYLPL
jgi:hypothetical protein